MCLSWQTDLRRALNLPVDASSKLLTGLCGTITVLDELYRRIQQHLSNDVCLAIAQP
jgi:hypothetical protein